VRLATYDFGDGIGPARIDGDHVIDLRALGPAMADILPLSADIIGRHAGPSIRLDRHRLLAPVPEPGMFLGVGLNYRDHAREIGRPLPARPALFAKLRGSVAPPFGRILRAAGVTTLDYEGELGVVVGRRCYRPVDEAEAACAIAGYVVVNDVSVRERINPDQVSLGKSAPGHGPFGPWITTADAIADPHALRLRTWVNGELRQDSSTANLHHRIPALVHLIASAVVLMPGDVIATGSPGGSGVGLSPPRYLDPGDRVAVEIDELGRIEHVIVDEDDIPVPTGPAPVFDERAPPPPP